MSIRSFIFFKVVITLIEDLLLFNNIFQLGTLFINANAQSLLSGLRSANGPIDLNEIALSLNTRTA